MNSSRVFLIGLAVSVLMHATAVVFGQVSWEERQARVASKIPVAQSMPVLSVAVSFSRRNLNEPHSDPVPVATEQTVTSEPKIPAPAHLAPSEPAIIAVAKTEETAVSTSLPLVAIPPNVVEEIPNEPAQDVPVIAEVEPPRNQVAGSDALPENIITVDAIVSVVQNESAPSPDGAVARQTDGIMEAELQYRDEIVRLIESKKFYPKRLQKMRQEGEVLVAFTLYKNGEVQGVEIIDAKGSALFKDAAIKAVKSAATFPPFPSQSSRETWSFRVPLSYRLLRS